MERQRCKKITKERFKKREPQKLPNFCHTFFKIPTFAIHFFNPNFFHTFFNPNFFRRFFKIPTFAVDFLKSTNN